MKINKNIHIIIVILSILLCSEYARCNSVKEEILLTYTTPIPPYLYQASPETTTGLSIHSLQSMLGENFFLRFKEISNTELKTISSKDVFIGTKPSVANLPFVKAFTITTIPLILFYKGEQIRSVESIGDIPIGYIDFGIPEQTIQEFYPSIRMQEFKTVLDLLESVDKGEIRAFILPEETLPFFTTKVFEHLAIPVAYIGLNVYISQENIELLNAITSTFIQKLLQEPATQASPASYSIIIFLLLILPIILFVLYKKRDIPKIDDIVQTTIDISNRVFIEYFLLTVTEKGVILSVSNGVRDILGYEPHRIIGLSIEQFQEAKTSLHLPPKQSMQHCTFLHINGTFVQLALFPIRTISMQKLESQYEFIVFNIATLVERQEKAFSILSLYQTIFSKSSVGIARYDIEEGVFLYSNPIFEKMTHRNSKELLRSSLSDVFTIYAQGIRNGSKHNVYQETIAINYDNKEMWFVIYATTVVIAEKSYIDMFLIDITEWHKAKQHTEDSYNYLRSIIDILPDPTFILDTNKYIIAWNKALEELTGVSAKAMLGKNDGSYSIPFYGSIRKMLCDTFYENSTIQNNGNNEEQVDTTTIESFCPSLQNGRYLWISASVLRDADKTPIAVIQTMQDRTKEKEQILALEQSKQRYAMILEASNEGIWEYDSSNNTIQASKKCYEILGLEPYIQVSYEAILSSIYPEYKEDILSRMKLLLEGKIEKAEFIFRIFISNSIVKWIQSSVFTSKGTNGNIVSIVGSLGDITERKEHENITRIIFLISNAVNIAREPKELFQAIHTILTRYVGYTNLIVALWNEKESCMEYPYYYDEYNNKELYTTQIHTKEEAPFPIADVFSSGVQIVKEQRIVIEGKEEECVWLATPLRVLDTIIGVIATHKINGVEQAVETVYSKNDKELMIAIGEQIGIAIERYNSKEQLTAMALHDPLTGLPNRVLFSDRLDHAIRRVNRSAEYRFAVFMLDLDRFKLINDTYGHNTGDLLLIEVANRIQPLLRSEDTFARLGGDEFAVILENIRSTHEVLAVAKRILRAIEQPLVIDGKELKTATSIGIVLDASSYDSAHTLLRDADIAMYDAKTNGKGRFRVFDQAMHQQMLEYVSLENELNNTIENKELFLEYQPVVDTNTSVVLGFEALVRWNHPEKGMIYPSKFINIAEENGFIIKLGTWVLEQACATMKQWVDAVPSASSLFMSVNLSAKQAVHGNLTQLVMEIIENTGINPKQLNLEVTETTIMKDPKNAKASFDELRDKGIRIAIDDFGSGYSSMTYLQRFQVDILKIDRAFIQNASIEDGGIEIVRAICALAHGLGMRVIAEGVETQEQLSIVKECNCDYIQGFLYSIPLSEEKALEYLEKAVKEGMIYT